MKCIEKVRLRLAICFMPKRFRDDAMAGIAVGAMDRVITRVEMHFAECPECRGGDDAE